MLLTLNNGDVKEIIISKFDALDGWDIQHRYTDFVMSTDKYHRRAFTLEILSYAKVKISTELLPLSTDALINNHIQSWDKVKELFEAVLIENGIDPDNHAEKPHYWANAGAEMAISFIAEASKLMGPAMAFIEERNKAEKE